MTARSSNACLIAQTALKNGLIPLRNQADLGRMHKVAKALKETPG